MDSPNLVIVEVTESPKEAGKKQVDEHQQQQEKEHQDEHQEEREEEEEEDTEAAQKSVIASTDPEPETVPQIHTETERLPVIADSNTSACYGCKMPFVSTCSEMVLMSPDLQWHHKCCNCSACGTNLGDSKQCHLKDGKPYCTEDYVRRFGIQCEGCQQWINNGDALVHNINGKTFHASCLCCNKCNNKLKIGDTFAFSDEDNAFLCSNDYQYWMQPTPSPSCVPGMFSMPPAVYAPPPVVGIPKGQPLPVIQRRPGSNSRSSRQRQREKKPRERTVYTDWQMTKLTSYYDKNPRPTTQEKESYAEELGVPKKKVSVWFQNRRCKDKKKLEIEERLEIANQQDQRREEEKAQVHQQPSFLPAALSAHFPPPKEYNESENHPQLGAGPIEVFPSQADMPWMPVAQATYIPPPHAMLPAHQHPYFGPPPTMQPEVQYNFAARGFLPPLAAHIPSPHPSHNSYSPDEYTHNHNSPPEANSPSSPYMMSPTDPQTQHHSQSPRNTYALNPAMYPHIHHTNSPSLASPPHTTAYSSMDPMQQAQYTFHLTHDGPY